jgi:hypothetical protein
MFDRDNRPKVGNVLKIGKGFVESVNESWAMLSKTERTIAERNGIHFFHDGDMFVVTPSNPSQYDDDFVCSLVCVGSTFPDCIGFTLNVFEYQAMPGNGRNHLDYIHLAKYLETVRETV